MDELLEIELRELPRHDPESGKRAHFFALATYQLQHPSRLTAEAASAMRQLVRSMVIAPRSVDDIRRDVSRFANRAKVARQAEPGDHRHLDGRWPRQWSRTVLDVLTAGDDSYVPGVAAWADATVADLDAALENHQGERS